MNEERASEGPPRGSGGSGGAFSRTEGTRRAGRGATGRGGASAEGAAGGSDAQREPREQVAADVPVARGGRRRVAAEPALDVGDLAQALQRSVAAIGTAGPPRAGLTRIRRRAKARARRRTVMAGGAGVLFMAMAVSVLTGNSFDIVPVLTGVVGLGGGGGGGGDGGGAASGSTSPAADGPGQVRTVRPTGGLKGPAIGPGIVAATPSALVASGVGACGATDLTTVASVDTVIGGVSYGHVEAVAMRTCAVAGPPVLQVDNAAANAASSVVILQHIPSDGSQLPQVPTWGTVLVLHAGQGYDFQFAWAPDTCPAASSSAGPTGSSAGSGGGAGVAGGGPSAVTGTAAGSANAGEYQLSYLVTATSPTSPVTLQASCGATVYVTDVYERGAYPLPKPDSATPTPPPSSTSAAPSSAAPPPPPSTSAPAPAPSSAAPSTGTAGGESPGAPAASPAMGTSAADTSTGQTAGP
ncbi:hypothetical protein KDL01_15535 [Actinospica durhamensis]|uniref:Uncharacterized protein n=1 Tax=Actinospica durhamensis TaxID=1508375 RepID=A0A941ITT1_9ACTN|nr:hypothetical protein [Actinospica durhamensis]MBR7834686.1 hypothetical protein [Actinospica durhamensis]